MFVVISPAKKLDLVQNYKMEEFNQPELINKSKELIKIVKNKSRDDLKSLMKISDKLADLNFKRFQDWQAPFTIENAKQAIFTFSGDTYTGFDSTSLEKEDLLYSNKCLRILSGLYGILKPLDLIQAYRLEMGIKLRNPKGEDLYDYWGDIITANINKDMKEQKSNVLINCASNEYFKSINISKLDFPVINAVFKEEKNAKVKIVSFSAKRARGMMARYITKNRIKDVGKLKDFDKSGYKFNELMSDKNNIVFIRKHN